MILEKTFSTIEEAALALADELSLTLNEAIKARGRALVAISGGRTPQHVFEHLTHLPVNWEKVILTLTDERWVAPDQPDSNERLVRSALLKGSVQDATFIPLYGGEPSPTEGQLACESRLSEIKLPFDAVYLGMGEDGHFASLFPGASVFIPDRRLCMAVPADKDRLPRMSLTADTILNSRKIYLLFSGSEKEAIYKMAKTPGSSADLPIRLILQQDLVPVHVLSAP